MRVLSSRSHQAPIDGAQADGMRPGVKAAVLLLVTLPMLAYVVGRLAVAPPDPVPRSPVIIERSSIPSPRPSPAPGSPSGDRDDEDDDAEDGGVRVIKPSPTRVGEDDAEREPEGDDRTDDDTDDGDD
jgi:hypothetical protein